MRAIGLAIAAAWLLAGCLTTIDMTPERHCAQQGMALLDHATSTISSGTSSRTYEHTYCRAPRTDAERCAIGGYQRANDYASRHNVEYKPKNWAIGFGYMLYVAPGAGLYYVWSDENRASYDEYMKIKGAADECLTSATAH